MSQIKIESKPVGPGAPCFIIAEVGLAHDGSLGAAHAYIDAAAEAGADAIKFQCHIAEAESTPSEQFRVKVFPQDATRYEYWKRTAFTPEQWAGLKKHATEKGLVFLCTPFSTQAARMLHEIGVQAWKIGSGDTNNLPMLEAIASFGQPVLLSTGMSYVAEIDASVRLLADRGVPVMVFQCTNQYPCPPERLGLNWIPAYLERYKIPVGLSDHSGHPEAGFAAVTLGASALEVHIVWDKRCFGPDTSSSLTIDELKRLVAGVRFIERALGSPTEKDEEAEKLQAIRDHFNKSIVLAREVREGAPLTFDDLCFKKPGTGIPASRYGEVVGRRIARTLSPDHFLAWGDLQEARE
jgi:N-acetylneuraminate synthase